MEKIFGVPMNSIMVAMLISLALCLSVVVYIFARRRVIFKLGVRNIPRRKAQTSLIIVGLMLATLIIAAALGTGDTLNHSVSADVYRSLGTIDEVIVASNSGDGEGDVANAFTQSFDVSKLDFVKQQLAGDDNVDAIGGILFSQAPVMNIGTNTLGGAGSIDNLLNVAKQSEPNVYLAGINEETYDALGGLKTTGGDSIAYSDVGPNDVVLSETAAEDLDAQPGDHLVLQVLNKPYEFTVKAVAEDSPLNGAVDTDTPSMMVGLATLQTITNQEGKISAIGISNKGGDRDGVEYTDAVVDKLKPVLESQGLGINPLKQDSVELAELVASIFVTFFLIFGLFSIAVGILLIVLIFTMLAAERRAEMGMERAVGAPRRALIQQFIAEGTGYALIAGLVGTLLGALVSIGIARGLTIAFGDFLTIEPYIHPRSMIVAYSLGVVITFLAVSLSSWRVSRLNIVAAVRDIPDAYQALKNRRQLIWGIIMVVLGAVLTFWGLSIEQQFAFTIGMTLIPFGLAAIVAYFGVRPRAALTVAGLYTLVFWLLPEDIFQSLFGEMSGNIEMFFVSGICIIAASTIVIIQNLDTLLKVVEHIGTRFQSKLPAIRLAIAYPGASKGRTGMTIAMFGLIVFSLVMIASINKNFSRAFLSTDATAGWTVQVTVPDTNPIDDFTGTLQAKGIDTSEFEGVGVATMPDGGSVRVRNTAGGDTDWSNTITFIADNSFWDTSSIGFSGRAFGYDSDEDVLNALKTDPAVAVVPAFFTQGGDFGDEGGFTLSGIDDVDKPFEAPVIEVVGADGQPHQVRVIGIIDSKYSVFGSMYTGEATGNAIFPGTTPSLTDYYIKLPKSVNGEEMAKDIERALLPNGAQAVDIYKNMEDGQAQQRSFFYILQGFMGLGLIVGVAAVGVIALRAVVERRQQIGMMRALGFRKSLVAQSFVFESAIVVILGVLSGAVLGLILAWELMSSDDFTEGASVEGFAIPYAEISVTLVTAIVAALLMAWLPARQASQVLPAEALRYE
jgi:putative ABC transport system permease protein